MTSYNGTICLYCLCDRGGAHACPHCGTASDLVPYEYPLLPPGTVLQGAYLIGRPLGRGGFAATYLALQTTLNRRVAIKEYLPADLAERHLDSGLLTPRRALTARPEARDVFERGLERFIEEGRHIVQCHHPTAHPNIVRVTDYFRENGTAYLVMDYVEGMSLKEYLDRRPDGRLDEAEALRILYPVLDGLRAVHERGFYHRDVKPGNIYIARAGPVMLLDFGSARMQLREETHTMGIMVTPEYAAPEQYASRGAQGPWTDVYGCAATLYHCVTGVPPTGAMGRTAGTALTPPSRVPGCRIAPALESVILWGLELHHGDRPGSVEVFQQALKNGVIHRRRTRRAGGPQAAPARPGRRRRVRLVTALLLVGIAVVAAALPVYLYFEVTHFEPLRRARAETVLLRQAHAQLDHDLLARYAPERYADARRLDEAGSRLQRHNPRQALVRYGEAEALYRDAAGTATRRGEMHERLEAALESARQGADGKHAEAEAIAAELAEFAPDARDEAKAAWRDAADALGAWRDKEASLGPAAFAALWDEGEEMKEITALFARAAAALDAAMATARGERGNRIAALLDEARDLLHAEEATPEDVARAHRHYQTVLEYDPENGTARRGLESVLAHYVACVKGSLEAGELDRGAACLVQAWEMDLAAPELEALEQELEQRLELAALIENLLRASPDTRNAVVAASEYINLRTGPGVAYAVAGTARRGDTLAVIALPEETAPWALIRVQPELLHWAHAGLLADPDTGERLYVEKED